MSTLDEEEVEAEILAGEEEGATASLTTPARLGAYVRRGGVIVPILTTLIAFIAGGFVVLLTGHNPFSTYKAIFNGTGLQWLFPWVTGQARTTAAFNLQQTLLATTPLILVGLAVAFAFRAGLFNIGGQGQYTVGGIAAVWIGSSFAGMPPILHITFAIVGAALAGAAWAGIAGILKATLGVNEVISTIMLNWIAYWIGSYLFQQGGPLQGPENKPLDVPISGKVVEGARIPVFWGNPELQGLHVGFFVAIGALVVFWLILNRTTLGYEVRAVGYNPDAAAYGGIKVRTNYIRAMAISGAFAGLAGGMDMLGYLYKYGTLDVQASSIGFLGIAVALLGRNTAVGVGLAAFLFGGLVYGTTQGLQSGVINPSLAGHLTELIEGLVVLFVGADLLILAVWNSRRRLKRKRPTPVPEPAEATP